MIKISQTIETDLLIVGGGIAGLASSVEAHKKGIQHILISKAPLGSGASFFPLKATLGIQVTGDKADQALFQEDVERVACGMNNPKIVRAYIEDSAQAVGLLNEIGFEAWQRQDNRPACFAQYPRPIFLINQWKVAAKRAKQIIAKQQTQVFENATLLHIATHQNQVQGAVFSVNASGQISYIFCKTSQIILAAGGIAGLYKDNLYPADVIGSTHAIALQAGASLTNLEYIQFIPAFVEPKYKVLFGEHTLKYCTGVFDQAGKSLFPHKSPAEFGQMVAERSGYAPFSVDFDCVEFDLVMMQHLLQGHEAVYLTYSPELYQDQTEFYRVYLNWLKQEVGIDLLKDRVAIAPFAHSCNGGIEIDEDAQSAVQGLFAVGEVSSCIEGANRLGGNSVGGSLVFAKRATAKIQANLQKNQVFAPLEASLKAAETALNQPYNPQAQPDLTASQVLSQMREMMGKYANVYRTEANLAKLAAFLKDLEAKFCPVRTAQYQGLEVYFSLKTAQAVVASMRERRESRGAHYRADFPQRDDRIGQLNIQNQA
ncbi:fumarate reductase [Pasteurellaceae bacterium RH1A]|nr:fumarate reductase [Pasteurellaceae bacterium RH1A]